MSRRTRQSLHDLVVGSYVVRLGAERGGKPKMWKGHYAFVALILVLTVAAGLLTRRIAQRPELSEMLSVCESIQQQPEVVSVKVFAGQTHFLGGNEGGRSISDTSVVVFLNRQFEDKNVEAAKFARIVLQDYPVANARQMLSVTVVEGFDIGIASGYHRHTFNYSPEEWRRQIVEARKLLKEPAPPSK